MTTLCCVATAASLVEAASRPNVVLIVSDDQAWCDYGFMGHSIVQTPNLDRLAQRSLVFDRGYLPAPVCRPSLASIITGLYPHQHGVVGNDVSPKRGKQRGTEDRVVQERFSQLQALPEILGRHGYKSFQSGKWWEGHFSNGGFTHGMTHGRANAGGRHGDAGLNIGRGGMQPVLNFIDEAIEQGSPFLVWYAPFMPHTPHNPPDRLLEKYQKQELPPEVARYYAMCEWFDETCGELLRHLEFKGVAEETFVAYVADNGWVAATDAMEIPDDWNKDFAPRSKGSCYEGGIRTPILLSLPDRIESSTSHELATSLDLVPTILAACGIQAPDGLPGINLLDSTARAERNSLFGAGYAIDMMRPDVPSATRQYRWCIEGPWKLLVRDDGITAKKGAPVFAWDKSTVQLFNLQSDPWEENDVAQRHPKIAEHLRSKIEAWRPTRATPHRKN